ncbi:MAG TPA: hypothetical protein VGP17_02520 [Solirubrobacteraceae bacterium]|jgi:hypothetical protein|nr:hypothetical protein [Solirubrobacteraceae bacterium]
MRRTLVAAVFALAALALCAPGAAAWSVLSDTQPTGAEESKLEAISCWTGEACMSVGDYVNSSKVQEPLAVGDEGVEYPPNPSGGKNPLLVGVSCTKGYPLFCMAVGEYTESSGYTHVYAEKYSGKTWTLETMPLPSEGFDSQLGAVSCPTSTECTAVGTYHNPITGEHYLGEQWKSAKWEAEIPTELAGIGYGAMIALSCPGSGECMASTVYRKSAGRVEQEGEELSGKTWTPETMANNLSGYTTIFTISDYCASLSECVAVGEYTNKSLAVEAQAQSWNGTWTATSPLNVASSSLDELWGVSCLEGIKECFAVGKFVKSGVTEALGEEFKSGKWALMTVANPSGAKETVLARDSCAPSVCYAAGWYMNSKNETVMLVERNL